MVFAPGGAGQSTLAVGLAFSLSKRTRLCAGQSAFSLRLSSLLRAKREPEMVLALVARGMFSLLVKWLALRAGQRQGGVFRLPPPYLWTPLSPQRVKGCSPLTSPRRKSKPKNASRFAKRIFCASPIYGSAEDFTFLLNFTPCKGVTPAAKQQVGETRKKRLAQRLAFFRFDLSSGV